MLLILDLTWNITPKGDKILFKNIIISHVAEREFSDIHVTPTSRSRNSWLRELIRFPTVFKCTVVC